MQIIRPKSREAWLELRKGGIGSSEVGTILGVNKFDTPYQLWRRKKGLDPAIEENEAMLMGHLLEDAVAKRWEIETGNKVIKASQGDWLMVDDERDFLRVSPDRTYWLEGKSRNKQNKGILECKTTMMDIDPEDVPKSWFCQLTYQLGVAGYTEGYLAWLVKGREFGTRKVDFNPTFYAWMKEKLTEFWVDYIMGDKVPVCMTTEDVEARYPESVDGKSREASAAILLACAKLRDKKDRYSALKKEIEDDTEDIKLFMEDADTLTEGDRILCTWKSGAVKEEFDKERFAKEHPKMYAEYIVPKHGSRTFRLK